LKQSLALMTAERTKVGHRRCRGHGSALGGLHQDDESVRRPEPPL